MLVQLAGTTAVPRYRYDKCFHYCCFLSLLFLVNFCGALAIPETNKRRSLNNGYGTPKARRPCLYVVHCFLHNQQTNRELQREHARSEGNIKLRQRENCRKSPRRPTAHPTQIDIASSIPEPCGLFREFPLPLSQHFVSLPLNIFLAL